MEIDVQGDKIRHFVNGEEILLYENPRYDPDHEIGKTLIINGDDKVKEGFISIQSNSHRWIFAKSKSWNIKNKKSLSSFHSLTHLKLYGFVNTQTSVSGLMPGYKPKMLFVYKQVSAGANDK